MTYLTGDTHGEFDRIVKFCAETRTVTNDVLVILGDAGINYRGERNFWGIGNDRQLKERLAKLPVTLLCIHGNHEMRPETIPSYEETERYGGAVYWQPEFPNLLFAKDGEIYELEGRRCIAIGGAYSVDKHERQAGRDWWPDEQPSAEIKARVERRLASENWRVDAVFSHTCPLRYVPRESFKFTLSPQTVDTGTEAWLGEIERRLDYDCWYCGHYHVNKYDGKIQFLFEEYRELR